MGKFDKMINKAKEVSHNIEKNNEKNSINYKPDANEDKTETKASENTSVKTKASEKPTVKAKTKASEKPVAKKIVSVPKSTSVNEKNPLWKFLKKNEIEDRATSQIYLFNSNKAYLKSFCDSFDVAEVDVINNIFEEWMKNNSDVIKKELKIALMNKLNEL